MKRTIRDGFGCALIVLAAGASAQAALIQFTGGDVVLLDTSVVTTNNVNLWDSVDYYEEDGFRLDFLPNSGSPGFSTSIGDYYSGNNDVIHSHWHTGDFGDVEMVEITKIGGGTFDLNFFTLTSNTDTGGAPASGGELAYVQGYVGLAPTGAPVLLPAEDWGFPGQVVFLGAEFDAVDRVVFYAGNSIDCFGMDNFFIDEVPAPSAVALVAVGGLVSGRRRTRG